MSALPLSSRQRRQLEQQLKNSRDVRLYRRTLAVLEYGSGRSVTEISRTLRVSRPSIYRWIERFRESSDPGSLGDEERGGRPPAWTEECSEWLHSLLKRSPTELGYLAVNWTVPLLRDALQLCLGKKFSDQTIRRRLHQLEYAWKRPRYVLAPDPEREKKTEDSPQNQALAARLRAAGGRRDRFAAVSSLARQLESTRSASAGAHFGLERASRRLRRDEPAYREATFLARRHQRQHDFQAFLELIHRHYRGQHVVLLLDENPSHTAKESQQLAGDWRIELLWLPKRAPELNPMDQLWGQGKDIVSANLQYPTIDDHLHAFIEYLECLTNGEARYTAGILSENFWLKSVL